jgi:ABC-type cobalamin/Fe3+-siderophores transport system ATPase subunit
MRFIKQAKKLAVNNIDPGATCDRKSRHAVLFPDTIRSLIVGPSGCGKTNLVFTLLTHANGLKFENVYIYSKTLHHPKYVMLEEILSKVDGVNLFKFQENDSVLPP